MIRTQFSNPVRVVFDAILQPAAAEDSAEAVAEHFRTAIKREIAEVHLVDRWVLQPLIRGLGWLAQLAAECMSATSMLTPSTSF
jgi:hypothetical protein